MRMTGTARRQHLIDVALHLFATSGFRGTTTKSIALAAGVSEGIIFRHFPTKEDLYQAILQHKGRRQSTDRSLDTLRRAIAADDDEGLIVQLAVKTFDTYRRDLDFQRLMLLAALEGHDLAVVSHRTLGLPVFGLLRDYVAKRQQAGAFRAGDPALLVFGLVALPLYFAIVTKLMGFDVGAHADRDVAATFARLALDGLRRPAAAPFSSAGRRRRAVPRTPTAAKPTTTSTKQRPGTRGRQR